MSVRSGDNRTLDLSTRVLHFKGNDFDPYDAVSTPLYQTATFRQPNATENGPYDYTRSGNPTRDALEKVLAEIEGAERAFAFSTGMAALSTLMGLVKVGEEIVAGDDIYGGTDRLLSRIIATNYGVVVKRVDTSDIAAVKEAISPGKTRLILFESPTNPRQIVSDIRALVALVKGMNEMALSSPSPEQNEPSRQLLLAVDNSILSPVLSLPLSLGVDIVMHSATKFVSGHSDVMAGVLAVKEKSLSDEVYFLQNAQGTALSPFDSWLCLRGVKTMALRVERQQENTQKVAEFLSQHPKITKVWYAGLENHPNRKLHYSQSKGAGSVLSFLTGSLARSKHIVENTKLANITVSFGGVSTSISLPCFMSHASIPAEVREERGLTDDLIRLSVGIESVEDLIEDLKQAIDSSP